MGVAAVVRQLGVQVRDIVFPCWCAGCGEPDQSLCASCRAQWQATWWRVDPQCPYLTYIDPDDGTEVTPFAVWACAWYRGVVSQAIVRWKNTADRRLDAAFALLLSQLLGALSAQLAFPAACWDRVVVVPVASSSQRRRRGRFVTGVLARQIAQQWQVPCYDVLVTRAHSHGGTTAVRGAKVQAQVARGDLTGCDVILVDDVVTSGATLAGASRAVAKAGGRVVGALVLAARQSPRDSVRGVASVTLS